MTASLSRWTGGSSPAGHSDSPLAHPHPGSMVAALGALGVVFGDIGTSPLYALRTAFSMEHNAVTVTPENVYGTISMLLWTIMLIVTVKYVILVTRADNQGQGGILALVALLRRRVSGRRRLMAATWLGVLGAALFYGDSIITPAISVMSAVEGLSVVSPELAGYVVPLSVAILAALFVVQQFGTGAVGRAFGPVMCAWFLTMVVLGIPQIVSHPEILLSLSPHWAVELMIRQPFAAFVLLGAVVLTVTGAEALYADLGHFGARAVRRSWLMIVMPALVIVYLGQGALVLASPGAVSNPFFHLAPAAWQIPMVLFATVATVIASQAVIAGAFSVTHQAIRLGLLPRLAVKHTSRSAEGQIYLPVVNWVLLLGVLTLVLLFPSSVTLASAYGLAVTGTFILESCAFLIFAAAAWHWRWGRIAAYVVVIGMLEVLLFAANTTKILVGGWIPLLVAAAVVLVMATWRRGHEEVSTRRYTLEGPISTFLLALPASSVRRIPGVAIFPHVNPGTTPLAMVQCVESFHVLHQQAVVVHLLHENLPHVPRSERTAVTRLGAASDGIFHVTIRVGFLDRQDIPSNLAAAIGFGTALNLNLENATYFVSVLALHPSDHRIGHWRQKLFLALERSQADSAELFHLPPTRAVVLGSEMHV